MKFMRRQLLFSVFKYAFKYYDFPNPYDKGEHIGVSI